MPLMLLRQLPRQGTVAFQVLLNGCPRGRPNLDFSIYSLLVIMDIDFATPLILLIFVLMSIVEKLVFREISGATTKISLVCRLFIFKGLVGDIFAKAY